MIADLLVQTVVQKPFSVGYSSAKTAALMMSGRWRKRIASEVDGTTVRRERGTGRLSAVRSGSLAGM